jgi:hypothetical protein
MLTLPLAEGDAGTAETIVQMCRLIDEGSKDPDVNDLAVWILRNAGVREFDFEGERRAIYGWFRRNIRFLRDVEGKEALRAPRITLSRRMGDCDCQTIAMLALLKTIGQRVRITTVATHPEAPDVFSHVYGEVRDERGRWIPVDTARKKPAYGRSPDGWFRRFGWDTEDCQPVNLDENGGMAPPARSRRARAFAGLSGYAAPRRRARGLRGLGQFDISQLESEIPAITTGTANIISAVRANPINLQPTTSLTASPATMTPAAQALLYGTNPFASIPSWMWLAGGAVLILAMMKGRG